MRKCRVHTTDRMARLIPDHRPDEHTAAEWPFAYHAEQLFELTADALTVTPLVQNIDTRPWPAGLGPHPYVARARHDPAVRRRTRSGPTTRDSVPAERTAVHGGEEFDRDREVTATLDNCYAGVGRRRLLRRGRISH